jgi:hypothetical protein
MRDIKNKLTSSKNTSNIQNRRGKSFGYQVLGFGAGGPSDSFIVASGGNAIVESGDYKTHIFTGPGTFTVSEVASDTANDVVDYLIVAGGAGTYRGLAGGGGAGGWRSFSSGPGSVHPLNAPAGITVTAQGYPIAVGGGGDPGPGGAAGGATNGVNTVALGLTSAGGGVGGASGNSPSGDAPGQPGGCGGGGDYNSGNLSGGSGNVPPVSPAQGTDGANGRNSPYYPGGGGGGGLTAPNPGDTNSNGGAGAYVSDEFIGPTSPSYGVDGAPISYPNTRFFAGGGGGSQTPNNGSPLGGHGGGGNMDSSGTANTGGGGGGASGAGGSGIVMIRYRFQ